MLSFRPVSADSPGRSDSAGLAHSADRIDRPADTRISMVGTSLPLLYESDKLTPAAIEQPSRWRAGGRFPRQGDNGPVRAFDRRIFGDGKLDLIAKFTPNFHHKAHPNAFLIEEGSNTGWSHEGVCVDAPLESKKLKGRHLDRAGVDEGLQWGVIRYWYPAIQLEIPPASPISIEPENDDASSSKYAHHVKKKKKV